MPHTVEMHAIDMPIKEARQKMRSLFEKNRHVKDLRVIDMLVVKVWIEDIYGILFSRFFKNISANV